MFPETGIISIVINLNVIDATTDQMVFFRHMQGNGEKLTITFRDGTVKEMTNSELNQWIEERIEVNTYNSQDAYLLEINRFGEYTQVEELIENEMSRLYGLLIGDEGWKFTPRELAQNRIGQNRWSSREFVSFIAFSNNCLLLNLTNSQSYEEYGVNQEQFFMNFYGAKNPYFELHSKFAGVNHGILFAVETGLLLKRFTESILDKQSAYIALSETNFTQEIKKMKSFRVSEET